MNIPKSFWSEALLTAVYLINRMHSQVLHFKTPIDVLCSDNSLFLVSPKVFWMSVMFIYIKGIGQNWIRVKKMYIFGISLKDLSQWILLFESISIFSPFTTSLQGKSLSCKERSQCLPSVLPHPTPVSPFSFDIPTSNNGKDILVYARKKNITTDPPLVAPTDPSNLRVRIPSVPSDNDIHSSNDDELSIALH